MSNPEGIQPEDNEIVAESDDFAGLEFVEADADSAVANADVAESVESVDVDDDDDDDDEESDDFEEWEPVAFPQDKLKGVISAYPEARQGALNAMTGVFKVYWGQLNEKMGQAHQVVQADRKASHDFLNAEEWAEVRKSLEEKREEIAADEKPLDAEIARITAAFNERIAKINADKQALVGDRILAADKLEADTVAGIKSDLLKDLGGSDNAVGEMQDIAKNIRAMERTPMWMRTIKKTRRDGTAYTKDIPVFEFPIPSWTKTLGKDGLGSVVTDSEGKKKVVPLAFLAIDGVSAPAGSVMLTYVRNKLKLSGSVTETVTDVLLAALEAKGIKQLSATEKFDFTVNDGKGEPHTITVLAKPTDE